MRGQILLGYVSKLSPIPGSVRVLDAREHRLKMSPCTGQLGSAEELGPCGGTQLVFIVKHCSILVHRTTSSVAASRGCEFSSLMLLRFPARMRGSNAIHRLLEDFGSVEPSCL
jgi:hypothetical protein